MKVIPAHLDALRTAIAPLDTDQVRHAYRTGQFPRADAVRDLDRRYRWDLLWAARSAHPEPVNEVLDAHYDDSHLDTALRAIVAPLVDR